MFWKDTRKGRHEMADDPGQEPQTVDAVEAERAKLKDAIDTRDKAKAKARELEQELTALRDKADKYDQMSEAQKTETQKLVDRAEAAEQRTKDAEAAAQAAQVEVLRVQVAAAKGLDPAQARRLQGTTEDELGADADDLLAAFKGSGKPPTERPGVRLTGGGDPEQEPVETDPAKLAALIPKR